MKQAAYFLFIISVGFLLISIVSCNFNNSDKENVESQNKERFSTVVEKKEAQFIVNATDYAYTILGLAELGGEQGSKLIKDQAQQLAKEQTLILNELKVYAQDHDISVQMSGPEKKLAVQNLYQEKPDGFDRKWCDEVLKQNHKMTRLFERYEHEADSALKKVIASSLTSLDQQEKLVQNKLETLRVDDAKE